MLRPHRILLLAFPNGQLLDIAGPLQMFAAANDEQSRQAYRIEIARRRLLETDQNAKTIAVAWDSAHCVAWIAPSRT